jgi:hypothetical protein
MLKDLLSHSESAGDLRVKLPVGLIFRGLSSLGAVNDTFKFLRFVSISDASSTSLST